MKKRKKYLIALVIFFVVALIMVSPQLFSRAVILGSDSNFHLNRLYDIAEQIRTGKYNYFQSNFGFLQSGRISNALYGPFFSYLLAVILIMCGSWVKFQIVSSIILLMLGSFGLYRMQRIAGADHLISILISIIFMGIGWFSGWLTGQEFSSWGTALIPYALTFGVRALKDSNYTPNIILFAASVSLIVQTHLLSAIFTVLGLCPLFLVSFINSPKKKKMALSIMGSAIIAIALSLNVLGAMLEVMKTNAVASPYKVASMYAGSIRVGFGAASLYDLGIVLSVIFLGQFFYVIFKGSEDVVVNTLTISGGIFIFCGSVLVPWNSIMTFIPKIGSLIQFPARITGMASILLLTACSVSICNLVRNQLLVKPLISAVLGVAAALMVFQPIQFLQRQCDTWYSKSPVQRMSGIYIPVGTSSKEIRNAFRSRDLGAGLRIVNKGTTDYLPITESSHNVSYLDYTNQILKNRFNGIKKVNKRGVLIYEWHSENTKAIQLPVIAYTHSLVKINHNSSKIKRSNIGAVIVKQKVGMNILTVQYQSSKLFKLALIASVLCWMVVSLYIMFYLFWPGYRMV